MRFFKMIIFFSIDGGYENISRFVAILFKYDFNVIIFSDGGVHMNVWGIGKKFLVFVGILFIN